MKGIPTFALTFHLCIIIINSKFAPIYAIAGAMVSAKFHSWHGPRPYAGNLCHPYNQSK